MEKTKSVLLMLVIVALFLHSSEALTCYDCKSDSVHVIANCEDDFKEDGIGTCIGFACEKQLIHYKDTTKTIRRCSASYEGEPNTCSEIHIGEERMYTCYCDSDKCNGAVMTSSVGHVMAIVALLINVVIGYLL